MFPSSIAAIPPGALDLTGEAVRRRRALQRATMGALEQAGYEELIPPTFEYEDTFVRAGGPEVAERLVRFPDRDGRILALRYDFTASLARVAATTFSDAGRTLRLCYSGKVFRQEPERGGRPREMLQVGAELLGQGDLAADIEIVRLTLTLLAAAGLKDFQINLGHVGRARRRARRNRGAAPSRREALDRPEGSRQPARRARESVGRRLHAHDSAVRHRAAGRPGGGGPHRARRRRGQDWSICWRSIPRSRPRSGPTSSTIWARCADWTTTPAFISSSTWPVPGGRRAPAAATTT